MKWVIGLEKVINTLAKFFQRIAIILLFFMMMLTVIDVTGRFFSSPLIGTFEMTNYTLALIVFLSIASAQMDKAHITVDFLVEKFSETYQRIINGIWYFVMFVVLLILGWQMFQYSLRMIGSTSAELQLPISFILIVASIGVLLYALTSLIDLIKLIYKGVESYVPRNH